MDGLNLEAADEPIVADEPPPKMSLSREKVLEEARQATVGADGRKKALSMVIVGTDTLLAGES